MFWEREKSIVTAGILTPDCSTSELIHYGDSAILALCSLIRLTQSQRRARGGAVIKAPRCKPEGCGIDSRWCHWNFSLT
jgi:hypothetical protein